MKALLPSDTQVRKTSLADGISPKRNSFGSGMISGGHPYLAYDQQILFFLNLFIPNFFPPDRRRFFSLPPRH